MSSFKGNTQVEALVPKKIHQVERQFARYRVFQRIDRESKSDRGQSKGESRIETSDRGQSKRESRVTGVNRSFGTRIGRRIEKVIGVNRKRESSR